MFNGSLPGVLAYPNQSSIFSPRWCQSMLSWLLFSLLAGRPAAVAVLARPIAFSWWAEAPERVSLGRAFMALVDTEEPHCDMSSLSSSTKLEKPIKFKELFNSRLFRDSGWLSFYVSIFSSDPWVREYIGLKEKLQCPCSSNCCTWSSCSAQLVQALLIEKNKMNGPVDGIYSTLLLLW